MPLTLKRRIRRTTHDNLNNKALLRLGGETALKTALRLPTGWIFARDAAQDEPYANREVTPRVVSVVAKGLQIAGYDEPRVRIRFYAGHSYGWLMTHVSERYLLSNSKAELDKISPANRPPTDEELVRIMRRRAAPIHANRPAPAPVQAGAKDGHKCFMGTIGNGVYLFDAGSGDRICEVKNGKPSETAQNRGLELIPRAQANQGAVKLLIIAWKEARESCQDSSKKK